MKELFLDWLLLQISSVSQHVQPIIKIGLDLQTTNFRTFFPYMILGDFSITKILKDFKKIPSLLLLVVFFLLICKNSSILKQSKKFNLLELVLGINQIRTKQTHRYKGNLQASQKRKNDRKQQHNTR